MGHPRAGPTQPRSPLPHRSAKIEKQLGWSPSFEFDTGLAETVRWYVENEAWWQDIFEKKGELQVNWT